MTTPTPAPAGVPLWSDTRINERINQVLSEQPNHTPRGLVRRVSYAMRAEYEAELAKLRAENADLKRWLGAK